jgi:UDP-sugar transporter A1/2/3
MWCFLLMGKRQSAVQIVALTILLFSALLFQGSISFAGLFQKKTDAHIIHTDTHDVEQNRPHTSFSKGILPCLGAAFISGLAGALSQKGVQLAGGKGRNAYLYTMELGTYSSLSLLVSMFATKNGRASLSGEGGIFKHWTPFSIIPITVRAMGGILTALVHKYAGATRKGFALILGLIMTGVMQSVIERERPSMDEIIAMFMVVLSSYLHLAFPPMA